MKDQKFSLRQRSVADLGRRVLGIKRTVKQWLFHAGIKFFQTHNLTEAQEVLLEDYTDFVTDYIDKIEDDKEFLKKTVLEPVQLPCKK